MHDIMFMHTDCRHCNSLVNSECMLYDLCLSPYRWLCTLLAIYTCHRRLIDVRCEEGVLMCQRVYILAAVFIAHDFFPDY